MHDYLSLLNIHVMKHLLQKLLLLIFLTGSTGLLSSTISAQGSINSCQIFYDELSPYGNWMNSPQYGYVWVPNVAPGFTPYGTNGYWAYTEDGWTWISNYAWAGRHSIMADGILMIFMGLSGYPVMNGDQVG